MEIEKIVWQPTFFSDNEFHVSLDYDFAKKAIKTNIPIENQRNFNETLYKMFKPRGLFGMTPLQFYGETYFVDQFSLGTGGIWLATNSSEKQSLLADEKSKKQIKYYSHNVDCSKDAQLLMFLFDKWAQYIDAFK